VVCTCKCCQQLEYVYTGATGKRQENYLAFVLWFYLFIVMFRVEVGWTVQYKLLIHTLNQNSP
jgi:hypothetical protein